jgi:hypothetical protein
MFAGAFQSAPRQAPSFLLVTEAPGAAEHVLIRESDVNVVFQSVRWHPVRNEILYSRMLFPVRQLYALEVGGSPVGIPVTGSPLEAEWSPAGNDVLYLHSGDAQAPLVATELRTVRRDGTAERTIFMPAERSVLIDLAVRRYP